MTTTEIFDSLWREYSERTPSAQKINELFISKGNKIFNDHVAFRTFDDPRVIHVKVILFAFHQHVELPEFGPIFVLRHSLKGQLISKGLFDILNSPTLQ